MKQHCSRDSPKPHASMAKPQDLTPDGRETDFDVEQKYDRLSGGVHTNFSPSGTHSQGFEILDDVQRYAVGALVVALLNCDVADLNEVAFARTQCIAIFEALHIGKHQQEALLSLNPSQDIREAVVAQCVSLIGDFLQRSHALHALLDLSVTSGTYDARSRAFLSAVAYHFGIPWPSIAAAEVSLAVRLCHAHSTIAVDNVDSTVGTKSNINPVSDMTPPDLDQLSLYNISNSILLDSNNGLFEDVVSSRVNEQNTHSLPTIPEGLDLSRNRNEESSQPVPPSIGQLLIQRRKQKQQVLKLMKIGGITLVGGMLFGLTGGIIAPALLPALAGIGFSGAASLAASGTFASGAVVGGLFGVAGGGFTLRKARRRVRTNLDEFDFERADDPRVIAERSRKSERFQRKIEAIEAEHVSSESRDECISIEIEHSSGPDTPCNDGSIDIELDPFQSLYEINGLNQNEPNGEDRFTEKAPCKKRQNLGKQSKKSDKRKNDALHLGYLATMPCLHVCICVPAWLTDRGFGSSLDQFEPALKLELPYSQHLSLRWESVKLYEMGLAFAKFWASKATVTTVQQTYPHALAAASTVAGAVAFAFAMPLTVMSCMDYIDNPWSVLVSRSNGAGEELADVLVERSYGNRPVTLFGYSIGARVVFKCLECLASRGAMGIVDSAFLVGAPVTADPERWRKVRKVVADRLVNAYGSHDWALAFFHRGCGHGVYVSGLRRVELEGVENMNMAYLGLEGHRELKDGVPRLMRGMGVSLGYISLPPAKLVIKGGKMESEAGLRGDHFKEVAVCEEPDEMGRMTNETQITAEPSSDISSESGREGHADLENEILFVSETTKNGTVGTKPSEIDSIKTRTAMAKMRKSKWKSWSGWRGSTINGRGKQSIKSGSSQCRDRGCVDVAVTPVQGIDAFGDRAGSGTVQNNTVPYDKEHDGNKEDSKPSDSSIGVESDSNGDLSPFDWSKQHEIWNEQERQMKEVGYADSAAEIELRNKVTLNISVEVAGRRLDLYIKQDSTLPVPPVERIFTNCVDDQRGMHIRVYEHERKTKTLLVNMVKAVNRYPKLIGEMEVRLKQAAEKGKLRVAISICMTRDGALNCWAEERFDDGSQGERVAFSVGRSNLCSPSERIELDEAEKRQIEAIVAQRQHPKTETEISLALPGPSICQTERNVDESSIDKITHSPRVPFAEGHLP